MTDDQTRAAFERWITETTALSIARTERRRYPWDDDYAVPSVESMWRSWRAAYAAALEAAAKECERRVTECARAIRKMKEDA